DRDWSSDVCSSDLEQRCVSLRSGRSFQYGENSFTHLAILIGIQGQRTSERAMAVRRKGGGLFLCAFIAFHKPMFDEIQWNRLKSKLLTARSNRGKKHIHCFGNQEEHRLSWRFFQNLEEGIRRNISHVIH